MNEIYKVVNKKLEPDYLGWICWLGEKGFSKIEGVQELLYTEKGYDAESINIDEMKEIVLDSIQASHIENMMEIASMMIEHSDKLFSDSVLGFLPRATPQNQIHIALSNHKNVSI